MKEWEEKPTPSQIKDGRRARASVRIKSTPTFLSAHFLLPHHTSKEAIAMTPQKAKDKTIYNWVIYGLGSGWELAQMPASLGNTVLAGPTPWSPFSSTNPVKHEPHSSPAVRSGLTVKSYQNHRQVASGKSRGRERKKLRSAGGGSICSWKEIKWRGSRAAGKALGQGLLPASFKGQSTAETQTTF